MKITDLIRTWNEISDSRREKTNGTTLRKVNFNGLHLGVKNENNQRIIVVELEQQELKNILISAPTWKGIKFYSLKINDRKKVLCLELVLKDYSDIFEAICSDFLQNSKNVNANKIASILLSVITKWKLFFEKNESNWLSKSQQKGLFGELSVLLLVSKEIGLIKSIDSWAGPLKREHDFSFDEGNLEVKTTSSKEHRKINISNEKQLDPKGLKFLYLAVLTLSVSNGQGKTLKCLVKECREIYSNDKLAFYDFEERLIMSGYIDAHEIYYDTDRYILKTIDFYLVDQDFPRINNIPEGVGDIKYTVMLSSCSSCKRDQKEVYQKLFN